MKKKEGRKRKRWEFSKKKSKRHLLSARPSLELLSAQETLTEPRRATQTGCARPLHIAHDMPTLTTCQKDIIASRAYFSFLCMWCCSVNTLHRFRCSPSTQKDKPRLQFCYVYFGAATVHTIFEALLASTCD